MKFLPAVAFLFSLLPLAAQAMPKPGPEHQRLAAHVGTWDAKIEMAGEDGKPTESKGVSVTKLTLGGFWLVDDFSADMMGSAFTGHGVTGYDPIKGKYVGTWVDSWTPSLLITEGGYDRDGKVLTMTGTGVGPDGKPAQYRHVTTHPTPDTMVFEMYATGADGTEMKLLKITYTRRVEKAPAEKPVKSGEKKESARAIRAR